MLHIFLAGLFIGITIATDKSKNNTASTPTKPRVASPIKTKIVKPSPVASASSAPASAPAVAPKPVVVAPVVSSKATMSGTSYQLIKPVVLDPKEIKNVELGYHKATVFQRVFWLSFNPLLLYWIIPFIICFFFIRLSIIPLCVLLVIFAATMKWPGLLMYFVFLVPFLPAIMLALLLGGGYAAIWYFVIRVPESQLQASSMFVHPFTSLTSDEQNTVNTFKEGVHSWTLNGSHTGAITSDIVLNGDSVGVKILFDDQSILCLAYSDIISFASATGTYTSVIPVRTLTPTTVMDNTVSSYAISYDSVTDHFTMTRS